MKLNNFVSVNVCFSTRDTIPSTKEPRPPSQTLHSEEKTEVPVGLEDKRSHGPSLSFVRSHQIMCRPLLSAMF